MGFRISLCELFGEDNITSDAEPEEMLFCNKKKAQEIYGNYDNPYWASNESERCGADMVTGVLVDLFGDKCLPDIPNTPNSGELKPQVAEGEPKFKVGDKVKVNNTRYNKYFGSFGVIKSIEEFVRGIYVYNLENDTSFIETSLEPYTEETKEPIVSKDDTMDETKEAMEEKELNLCELLKGCEGEKFFSSVHGEVTFYEKSFTQEDIYHLFFEKENGESFYTLQNGTFGRGIYPIIYPSRALYEKYPLDPYSAWMEWKNGRNPYRIKITVGYSRDNSDVFNVCFILDGQRFPTEELCKEAGKAVIEALMKVDETLSMPGSIPKFIKDLKRP